MPIDGGMRGRLEPGTVLVARYKDAEYRAEVVGGEDGKTRFRLEDGREFRSPSSAASAVMGGIAANGWRFWSLQGGAAEPAQVGKSSRARRPRVLPQNAPSPEIGALTDEVTSP